MPPLLELDLIEVSGTPAACGAAVGEALRPRIQAMVAERLRAVRVYLFERGSRDVAGFVALGAQCLEVLRRWDAAAHAEHLAMAAAAGVDAAELYTCANMTDLRDVLLLGGGTPTTVLADAEGCTTALLAGSRTADGAVLAGQTWDLNPGDVELVAAIRRRAVGEPAFTTITVAGGASLMGMNEHGLAFGTTNIKTRGSRIGVGYLSVLHRVARCRTRAQAAQALLAAPRAAAHTYWLADAAGIEDHECSATTAVSRDGSAQGWLCRTNHCLSPQHQQVEGEPPSASTQARLRMASQRLAAGGHTVESLKALFSDRSQGVDSINRYAADNQGTATDAVMICQPAQHTMHACRGPADQGRWYSWKV